MTQSTVKNQAKKTINFRQISPHEIIIPQNLQPNIEEVEKYTNLLLKRGTPPEPIITQDNELIEGIDQLEAFKKVGQETILAIVKTQSASNRARFAAGINISSLSFIQIEKLLPHPLQKEIYGEENVQESRVFEAIRETGDIEPITVTPDASNPGYYRIIKGHTRVASAQILDYKCIPAYTAIYSSQEAEDEAFLSSNTYRQETNEQKARRAACWWQLIQKKNQERIKAGIATEQAKSITREEVGKIVGWSGTTTEHAIAVIEELPSLPPVKQVQVREAFGKSVDAAYKAIKPPAPKKWKAELFQKVEIIGGGFAGKRGEIRGLSQLHAQVCLEGESLNSRENVLLKHLKPIAVKPIAELPIPPKSIKEEEKEKAEELGLRRGTQALPDVESNTGLAPAEPPLQASYTGLTSPADVAIALCQLTPEQILQMMSLAMPELSEAQEDALDNALTKYWRKAAG